MDSKECNVLYISYDGMTDVLGQSQVIPYLTGLAKKGINFTLLSCEKKEQYAQGAKNIRAVLAKAGIGWEPIKYTKKPPVFSTLYDYFRLIQKAKTIHRNSPLSMIHCRSYIPALAGLYMKRKYGIPYLFDMRGFWADERVDGGIWNLKNPIFKLIYKYFKRKEAEFLAESAAVVSLTAAAKNELLKWKIASLGSGKITVIPCCVDMALFNPDTLTIAKKQALKQQLAIKEDDFVLGYLGSIGTWYMLDEMLQYFVSLKKNIPGARFLFVTPNGADDIRAKGKEYHIDTNDIIITQAGRNDVPAMIDLFNYGIFFIKPSYSKMASSPTKQGEIMAMGVPVICNAGVGDTDDIVNNYHSGFVVDNFDFSPSIHEIIEKNQFNKGKIRARAVDFFSLEKGVDKYYDVYFELLKPIIQQ